jgi:hypothetical protein
VNAGSAKATLLVGGKADDTSVYARDASKPAVMTMDSTLADDLRKNADEYSRKDVFAFRAFTANRIDITRNGQTVAFEKAKADGKDAATEPEKWRRVSPSAGDVDNDKVAALLTKLESMKALTFVESTAKTGLDSPAATVVAKFEDGKKEDRVVFGKSGDNVYAQRQGEPVAAKIDTAEFNDANTKLMSLSRAGLNACATLAVLLSLRPATPRRVPQSRRPPPHPALSAVFSTTSTQFFPRPPRARALGRAVRSSPAPTPCMRSTRAADAGVQHEDRHVGGCRQPPRLGLHLRNARARLGRDRLRHSRWRSAGRRVGRSEHRGLGRLSRATVRKLRGSAEGHGRPRHQRPDHRR